MRLVLGLAALATAISGVANASYISSRGQDFSKAEMTVHKMEDIPQYVAQNGIQHAEGSLGDRKVNYRYVEGMDGAGGGSSYYEEIENNDTVSKAQDIGQYMANQSSWNFSNYSGSGPSISSAVIHGNIAAEKGVDWYTFTLFGKANVSINLTRIAADCDYDMKLFRKGNSVGYASEQMTQVGSSTYSSNHDENISKTLNPGIYYLKVYSFKGYAYTQYYLTCSANYQRQDVCIEDMMAKGAKAALWLADYDPFGIQPSSLLTTHTVGSRITTNMAGSGSTVSDSYQPEFAYEFDKSYKQAELFVWDHNTRIQLRNFVRNMLDQANANYTDKKNLVFKVQKEEGASNVGVEILSAAAGSIPYVSWVTTIYGVMSGFITSLFPQGNIYEKYTDIIDYLGDLYTALECDDYTGDQEVVRIPINYRLSMESGGTTLIYNQNDPRHIGRPIGSRSSTYYHLSYEPQERQWEYLYNDGGKTPGQNRYIHAVDHERKSPFTGTIYPIVDNGSASMAWGRQTYDMSYTTMSVNGSQTFSLTAGSYKWFKFTAPNSGTFYFRSEGDPEATFDLFDNMVYGKLDYHKKLSRYKNNSTLTGYTYSKFFNSGETVYFRISGGDGTYCALSSTTVIVSNKTNQKVINFYADQLNIGTQWNDPIQTPCSDLQRYGLRVVAKESARINSENWYLELEADTTEDWYRSFITIEFDRPVKTIAFDAAYGTWWRYSRNPLIVNGFNANGQNVVTYWENSMEYDFFEHYQRYSFTLQDPSQGMYDSIYTIQLLVDPSQTQDSYHNTYELVQIDGFSVEFAD